MFSTLNIKGVFSRMVLGFGRSGLEKKLWPILWCAITHVIWKKRNQCIFNHDNVNWISLVEEVKFVSLSWLHSLSTDVNYTFVQWSSNVNVCLIG